MKIKFNSILIIFIVMSIACVFPVWAQNAAQPPAQVKKAAISEQPTIKVAISDDQSIVIERVLYEALKRSGYQMLARTTGMRNAVADVNYGDAAILSAQTDGWDKQYTNLVKVPVSIDHVEFTVYTSIKNTKQFSAWSDLAGLRLGFRWQNEFVANNIRRAGASRLVRVSDVDELWESLLKGETDAVILPRLSHLEVKYPEGTRKAGIIERLPVYSYVNRNYDYLVPVLEKVYKEMIDDGTIKLIHSGKEPVSRSSAAANKHIILHLNSYNTQNEWERSQMEAIRISLEKETSLEYYSINLNTNEPHSQANFNLIISEMIRTEFIARYPDLIISSGDEAFEYVLANYHLLFSNVPVLFYGVQKFNDAILYGLEKNATGIFEEVYFFETISQMLKTFPETKKIYILNGNYLSRSICLRETILEDLRLKHSEINNMHVEIEFNEEKPLFEILEEISGFGSDTLVLIGNYFSDSDGTFYSEAEIQRLVSEASLNPVFCLTSSYIGNGTFGGFVSLDNEKSKIVASMAVEILKGTPLDKIPIISDSTFLNQWQFDYKIVKKFNISSKNLPANHVLINRVLPLWETNPTEFRLILFTALLLLMIIFGLILFFIRNSRMTKDLHNTTVKLEAAVEEALNANKAKSSFLANMSHEIRTPMNAILGIAEIQLRDETLSTETEDAIQKIYESGDLLLNIINDILDLSKIEAGKLELMPFKYDMPSLINDSVQLNRLRYDSKPIEFFIHMDENTPQDLFGDELRIKQVLNNILSNAYKYTDEGEVALYISYEPFQSNSNDENVMLVFRIRDTGQGMTEEQIAVLFDEYTRFNADANRKTVGTGLGMSITKHLVDLMKGELTVQSVLGEGSEFTVRIPQRCISSEVCGREVAEKLRNFNFRSTALTNKTQFLREYMPYGSVLVVDDVESNIYVIKGMLLPYGIKIDAVSSGFDAIKKIIDEDNVYDIVFMDHMMPKMDGIETVKKLREMGYRRTIVALTANALIGRAEMFLKNGFDGFISKPIDSRELNVMLNELIRNKKPPEVIEAARYFSLQKKSAAVPTSKSSKAVSDELAAGVSHDIENALSVMNDILPLLNSGGADLKLLATTVHGMKSALANIGEIPLSHIALRLEQASSNAEIPIILTMAPEFINSLKLLLEKLKKYAPEENEEIIQDLDFLKEKMNEIKEACGRLNIKDAKETINELKQKRWPRKINEIIYEISLYLIRGEYPKVVTAADNIIEGLMH